MSNYTDKELLRLSALAADISVGWNEKFNKFEKLTPEGWIGVFFDPLTDDGDALRLAVILDLQRVFAGGCEHGSFCYMEPFNGDPHAATRRAIVRAAAAIGSEL